MPVERPVQSWFPSLIYRAPLLRSGAQALNRELLREARQIREFDVAGQRWSSGNYPGGYTSYGSMDQLHRFSSTFEGLQKRIDRHVTRYVTALEWDLQERPVVMTDCWLNIMPPGCAHSFHIHPQAVISGTYYVSMPRGSSGLKFEDPRLAFLMAAPPRKADSSAHMKPHVEYRSKAGDVVLFESWLRHEVPAQRAAGERVSISFNYHWL
jgi:uncharacterized protein (TIGR02466 family)